MYVAIKIADKDMWNEVIKDHYNIFSYILSASSLYIVLPVGKEFNGVRFYGFAKERI